MDGDAGLGSLPHSMLLGGPAAALAFGFGVTWLGLITPGYSAVRQTISELGPLGGKGRKSLAVLNLVIALSALLFAWGLLSVPKQSASTSAPGYLVGLYAILAAGLAAFPSRHRLHNVFGLLQTFPFVGAPLAVAVGWRGQGTVATVSWAALVLLIAAMALNIAPLFSPRLAKALAPVYGLVQRSIFVTWYGWFLALGVLLFVRS
jgi:hypothetical membrane protein